DQALTIVVSQAAAVATAIFLLPVLLSLIYRNSGFSPERYSIRKFALYRMHEYIEKQFLLKKAVSVFLMGAAIVVGIISGYLIKKQIAPSLPITEQEIVIRWNEPLTATANLERLIHLTDNFKNQVQHFEIFAGRQQYLYGDSYDFKEQEACIYFSSGDIEGTEKITDLITRQLKQQYPAASFSIREPLSPVSRIFTTGGEKIYVKLYLENEGEFSVTGIDTLQKLFEGRGLRIIESPGKSKVMIIRPVMENLAMAGIAPESFYQQLNSYISPVSILQMSVLGSSVPLYLIPEESVSWMNLLNQPVLNAQGQPFPFGHFIKTVSTERVEEYYTDATGTFVRFAIVPSSENFNSFQHWIQQLNEQGFKGKLVVEDYHGKVKAVLMNMLYILIISVILLYLILAAQFESLIIPLIVLIELPVDFSFVLLALWISGTGLNIMSFIGLVVISGLVINDSILKIDKIIQEVRSGNGLLRSVLAGGRARLNSILITSLTTIFAVVPQMFGRNLATALQNPVSLAIAVGLSVGTLVSIYLIPALFYYLYKTNSRF
ncbi:MAG: efflux RND transporter permease subunit, partial [Bacteroidales bacterium]|nr:efflux RND transporter permease subunit [Bacteroidales bacterium]